MSPGERGKAGPREAEDVLHTRPAVREAAVVGAPGGHRGETVKAFVGPRPGAGTDPASLAAYGKERLAACTWPCQAEILPEPPRTASGRILRREPRSPAHENEQ
ncbi:hypothetical protein ADK41_01970 [Streptomyces caelestis]|uniref:AMP-binding enzyme C-terminal domain-containing protein n=1 Tax=Streptomyces caelestis TaxID=36816 RepID=A0A0M9XAY4_9ACTN|nr:hypothetical protein ADK41_01970 [Streptomyces caelestis]